MIHLASGCDDTYACHFCVMLLSMFENCPDEDISVHLLVPAEFSAKSLIETALAEKADKLIYHILDDRLLAQLKQRRDLSAATYYRLMLGQLLQADIKRVIYLDCDLVIRGNIADLWSVNLQNKTVAAVRDLGFTQFDILGLSNDRSYFNAGVLVIDLDKWRTADTGQAAFEFANSYPDRITFNDQCALNWVLQDRWLELNAEWNLLTSSLMGYVGGKYQYFKPAPVHALQAKIVHFNSPGRPWLYMDEHPFKSEYEAYRSRTPWRNIQPADRTVRNILKKTIKINFPKVWAVYRKLVS